MCLPQADIPFEKLKDPEAIANWPETMGRDGARTPMPWSGRDSNGGWFEFGGADRGNPELLPPLGGYMAKM